MFISEPKVAEDPKTFIRGMVIATVASVHGVEESAITESTSLGQYYLVIKKHLKQVLSSQVEAAINRTHNPMIFRQTMTVGTVIAELSREVK